MKCLYKDISSALTPYPPPSLYLCLHKILVLKISQCAQPIGEIFPTLPPSLFSWIADNEVDYEIR